MCVCVADIEINNKPVVKNVILQLMTNSSSCSEFGIKM